MARQKTLFEQLQEQLGEKVEENKNIAHYITLRTHTTAQFYFEASTREDWINAYKIAHKLNLPVFVLGGGSNMAILTPQISGLVVRNMYMKKALIKENAQFVHMLFSSGYPMARVVKETIETGYAGFEYHFGLPGTIGGAVAMNSKWTKPLSYIGDNLVSATLIDHEGKVKLATKEYFDFAYDYSILQKTHEILLEATFLLPKAAKETLQARAQAALSYRKQTQPFGVATGGCFFQNISEEDAERAGTKTLSAGNLIDKAGLKGVNIGGFEVSQKHANFIINNGKGESTDLIKMITHIQKTVKEKFGVMLQPEVKIFK